MIKTRAEVEAFLNQFMPKLSVFGILYMFRDKNQNALRELGITPDRRTEVIKQIVTDNYVETIRTAMAEGDMWVFGKDMNGRELYIKIAMGQLGSNTICISFHIAERPIHYAFKDKED